MAHFSLIHSTRSHRSDWGRVVVGPRVCYGGYVSVVLVLVVLVS